MATTSLRIGLALPCLRQGMARPMRARRRNPMSHRMKMWLPHDFDMTLPLGPTSDQLKEELQTRLLSRYEGRRRLHPWAPISRKTIPSNRIECNAAAPLARPRAMPVPSILPMACHALPCLAMSKARHGKAWQGMARHGKAWQGMASHGKPWQGMARHGKPWQGMARHGKP